MTSKFYLSALCMAAVQLSSIGPALADQDDEASGSALIKLRDSCDPPTFNAALGAGTCVGEFRTTFQQFLTELGQDMTVGAWRMNPRELDAEKDTQLVVSNFGGETHTFTQVQEFGGGFVAALNAASGNSAPAPECAQMVNGNLVPRPPSAVNLFVAAGQTVSGPIVENGKQEKFQCCIHPWMRLTVNPNEGHEHH